MASKRMKLYAVGVTLLIAVSYMTYLLLPRINDMVRHRHYYQGVSTISFEACEGLTNQRIAIIEGIMLGHLMKRDVILPKLYSSFNISEAETIPFSAVYDVKHLRRGLRGLSNIIEDSQYSPKGAIYKAKNLEKGASFWTSPTLAPETNLDLSCTFNALKIDTEELVSLFWTIDSMLVYNAKIMKDAKEIIRSLNSSRQGYTALHFRIEDDWVEHCKRWENIGDGIIRDNCMTNTKVISNVFKLERIPLDRPLYIAGAFTKEFMQQYPPLAKLMQHYKVVTKDDLLRRRHINITANLLSQRELYAAIDFTVCSHSEMFVGNSVSTFSAFIELRRMREQKVSIHYNGGNIPLAGYIPPTLSAPNNTETRPLKWVFSLALTSQDHGDFIDMAKVAVTSAINNTRLDPVCLIYIPSHNKGEPWVADIIAWLRAAGVTLLHHVPKFSTILKTVSENNNNKGYSPLYTDHHKMIGTFLRIDIPKLGFIDDYVLYIDADVIFTNDVSLNDFEHLPKYLLMAWESKGEDWYGNAGVSLFNVIGMRRTYSSFLNWAFSATAVENGLLYGPTGPLDQGALNGFYTEKIITSPYVINHRPYWGLAPPGNVTSVVHFHGPKPRDYLNHRMNASLDNPNFQRLFQQCDDWGDQCYDWVDQWVQINSSIHDRNSQLTKLSFHNRQLH